MNAGGVGLLVGVAAFCLFPMGAAGAGARRFGTGYLTAGGAATGTICAVTNLGSKAVSLGPARALLAPPGAPVVPSVDECSLATLEPLESCRFSAAGVGLFIGGGYVEVLGDSRGLRGQCTLVDTSGATVFAAEMR